MLGWLARLPTEGVLALPRLAIYHAWALVLAIGAGGFRTVDPLYHLETGATLALPLNGGGPRWFLIYYLILALLWVSP